MWTSPLSPPYRHDSQHTVAQRAEGKGALINPRVHQISVVAWRVGVDAGSPFRPLCLCRYTDQRLAAMPLKFYTYAALTAATDDWADGGRLGKGGFGEVRALACSA